MITHTGRLEVLNIILGSFGFLGSFKSCDVFSLNPPCQFKAYSITLEGSVLVCLIRYPRGTNWDSF